MCHISDQSSFSVASEQIVGSHLFRENAAHWSCLPMTRGKPVAACVAMAMVGRFPPTRSMCDKICPDRDRGFLGASSAHPYTLLSDTLKEADAARADSIRFEFEVSDPKVGQEIIDWCRENIFGPYSVQVDDKTVVASFNDSSDAVYFRMRW